MREAPSFTLGEPAEADSNTSAPPTVGLTTGAEPWRSTGGMVRYLCGELRLLESLASGGGWCAAIAPDPAPTRELLGYYASADQLASNIAHAGDLPCAEVLAHLGRVSGNLETLLHSPQGWTVLSGYIAASLEAELSLTPTIH